MATETALVSLFERLSLNTDIVETLGLIKTAIVALPPSELRRAIPNLSVSNVFACLNTNNRAQLQACGEVLDRMLSILSASIILETFHSQLLTWLQYPDEEVRSFCMPQVSRLSREVPKELCEHEDLMLAIVDLLNSARADIGPAAAVALTNIGKTHNGLRVIFSEPVKGKFISAMEKSDTVRFRLYQMATDLSALSPDALSATVESGLLQQLVNEMKKDDILIQLNAIELLSDLSQSPHGLLFLDSQGIVGQLESMMLGLNDNPMAGLLLPGLIKFFGGLARNHPKEVLSKFDHFVRLVLSNIGGGDPALRGVSLDTIGFIGRTAEGKLALEKLGNPMTECVTSVGSLVKTGTSELKPRALGALSNLIYLLTEYQTSELLHLTEKWFKSSMSNPLQTIWSIAQQPFADIRIPALHTLQCVAMTPWGQVLMNNMPGFKEYVLDRATENTKEGKDEKYELVNILANSPTTTEIMGRPYQLKLMEYYNDGPYFVQVQSEVAMEGE